ncbi:hypothetical protein HF086_005324 [Spodoptera exigua]|uniref:Anoctamin n=1 Tax=Spodoptera exigua TaxID=7107 RepID=A0A922N1K3_SPOEX|nr:hypothetical protein HF086_005324 [Spodoptera exigua]
MEGEDGSVGNPDKEDYESSTHSTPQEHRSFAEFAKDKLDSAGRELRRRLPMAGQLGAHLMHPRRLLLHSTPTQHTDVVLIFPKGTLTITFSTGLPDSMLLWLLQKLRGSRPRLRVCVRQHASSQCSAFYITADDDVLLQTAEEMHLPKQLKPEFGGGYKEFTVRDMHCFQKVKLLNSQERGALVKHALESARAEPGDEHALEPALTLRPGQSIVPACVSRGVVASMFPLHERNALENLRKKWVKTLFSPQPIDEISEYFGVKIAMYFAWLGHYTRSLTVPAAVGFIFWIWLGTANENWKDIAYVLFSLFNVLWACVYLETWKRYSNVLAYKWGTLDQRDELLVEPRPLFELSRARVHPYGTKSDDLPDSNMMCKSYSLNNLKLLLSHHSCDTNKFKYVRLISIPKNYRLETKYENHLIVKIALQLAVLLITRQVIGNLKESALPYLIENLRLAKICVDVFGAISPSKIPTSAQLTELFEKKTDSSGDPPENSLVNGGTDKEKDDRRDSEPIVGQKVIHQAELESQLFKVRGEEYYSNLEIRFFHAMEAMVAVAVLVNCALIGLSGPVHRMLPDATPAQTILVIVALEHVILVIVLALRIAIPEIPAWLATEMAKVEFQRREAIKNAHAPLMPASDKAIADKKKLFIGKIPEIPPFRPKAASITTTSDPPVTVTGSLQALPDVSPTKPIRRKEATPGAPLSLLGVRGLRDEPLHRSAHCIPHPTQHRPLVNPTLQELSGSVSAGGSEPDLNAVPSSAPSIDASATSSEDDKPKDKGSE